MPEVLDSILQSVKKLNSVDASITAFDNDFIMYINGALADLNQVGIGPSQGFAIEDENDDWEDFLGDDPRFNAVKTYVGLYVRLRFDPPGTSFSQSMMKEQLDEHLNRLLYLQQDVNDEVEVDV